MKTLIVSILMTILTFIALAVLMHRANKREARKMKVHSRLATLNFERHKREENRKNAGFIR